MSKKIFLSHSSEDKKIVDSFMDNLLINVLGISINDIFYTSGEGTKIKSGEDWRQAIKNNLLTADVLILFITPNYKQSEICLNEMGAAWACGKTVLPVIVPPISYESVGVTMNINQIEKLDDEQSLDRIKDVIVEIFNIENTRVKSDRWTSKKKKFLMELENYIEKNPFKKLVTNKEFDKISKDCEDYKELYKESLNQITNLEDLVEKLKVLKDKKEVANIIIDNSDNLIDIFEEVRQELEGELQGIEPAIRTIIFNNYANKDVIVGYDECRIELNKAVAKGIITDDRDLCYDNLKIIKILEKLDQISNMLKEKEELVNLLEDEYNVSADISNLEFWETVLKIKMYYLS